MKVGEMKEYVIVCFFAHDREKKLYYFFYNYRNNFHVKLSKSICTSWLAKVFNIYSLNSRSPFRKVFFLWVICLKKNKNTKTAQRFVYKNSKINKKKTYIF